MSTSGSNCEIISDAYGKSNENGENIDKSGATK